MKGSGLATKGIIFDLDGTLVDTLDDLTDSMNYALKTLGFPTHRPEICRKMIGNGLTKFAERALGAEGLAHIGRLLDVMTAHYLDHCLRKTRPYPGLSDVILELRQRGILLGVLTNKNQKPAEKIANFFFGTGTFDPIIGYQAGQKTKPDPDGVQRILEAWGLTTEEVILVGDSEVDIQTAAAAGVLAVGVAWGFRSREELRLAGADKIIEHSGQILDLRV